MSTESGPRCGFTLIEVVVALALGALAVALAAALTRSTADAAGRTSAHVSVAASESNGERLLRRLIGQMELSSRSDGANHGDAQFLRFTSWCDDPRGWQERCAVEMQISAPAEGIDVFLSSGERLHLMRGRGVQSFLFLRSPEHGGRWSDRWIDRLSVPPAVGVVIAGDTLLFRVEERG